MWGWQVAVCVFSVFREACLESILNLFKYFKGFGGAKASWVPEW
jgi:hypothetical protein